jgi:hypothetical protein
VLVGVLGLGAPSPAQIYKLVDGSGTIHFSDDPPPRAAGAPAMEVLPESAPRPRPTRAPTPPSAESVPLKQSVAPPRGTERGYGSTHDGALEPEQEDDVGQDATIVDEMSRDPAVRWRANAPRTRRGQPIRQPNPQPRRAR